MYFKIILPLCSKLSNDSSSHFWAKVNKQQNRKKKEKLTKAYKSFQGLGTSIAVLNSSSSTLFLTHTPSITWFLDILPTFQELFCLRAFVISLPFLSEETGISPDIWMFLSLLSFWTLFKYFSFQRSSPHPQTPPPPVFLFKIAPSYPPRSSLSLYFSFLHNMSLSDI